MRRHRFAFEMFDDSTDASPSSAAAIAQTAICGASTAYSAYGDIAVIEPAYSGDATAYSSYSGTALLECCGC